MGPKRERSYEGVACRNNRSGCRLAAGKIVTQMLLLCHWLLFKKTVWPVLGEKQKNAVLNKYPIQSSTYLCTSCHQKMFQKLPSLVKVLFPMCIHIYIHICIYTYISIYIVYHLAAVCEWCQESSAFDVTPIKDSIFELLRIFRWGWGWLGWGWGGFICLLSSF